MNKETFLEILEKGRRKNASDIHLVIAEVPVFRIDGKLIRVEEYEKFSEEDMDCIFSSIIPEDKKKILVEERELDFSFRDRDKNYRINAFYERDNLGMVIRIIKENPLTLEELNMNNKVYDLLDLKQGLLIVAGKSGSGKSSTLAAIIDKFNKEITSSILTIEDPIEFIFKNKKSVIKQREIPNDTKNFIRGMKSALREDVDIIMVGELRDSESIEMALKAAETGHIVLSTLHTNGAVDTIERIISTFSSDKQKLIESQLASNLIGVIYQELIQGKNERVPLCEIMKVNRGISNLIRNDKINQIQSFIDISGRDGMLNKEECLKWLYKNKKITENKYTEVQKKLKGLKI